MLRDWTDLLCLARWDARLAGCRIQQPPAWGPAWPPEHLKTGDSLRDCLPLADPPPLSPETCHQLADVLRKAKMNTAAEDEVCSALRMLEGWMHQSALKRGDVRSCAKYKFSTRTILASVRLSRKVRGGVRDLKCAVDLALDIVDGNILHDDRVSRPLDMLPY